MSFDDMREKPQPKNFGLRTDWSLEEKRFQDGLKDFHESIAISNSVQEDPPYRYDPEKIIKPEVIADKEVPKQPEKSSKKVQDEANVSVESVTVQRSNVDSLTIQPMRPTQQESVLSKNSDPFDDVIISKNSPENYMANDDLFGDFEQPKKPAAKETTPTKVLKPVEDFEDFIPPKPSTPAPAANPIVSPPTPVASISVAAPAASSAPSAKPTVCENANVHVGAAQAELSIKSNPMEDFTKFQIPKPGNLEGFDYVGFAAVCETVLLMLRGCPNLDLDYLQNNLGEYSVNLNLDHYRERPHILADCLLAIQAKRDSLHAESLRLTPLKVSFKHAAEHIETAGLDCSSESSKEKRSAQLHRVIPEFWVRYARVDTCCVLVEKTFMHLEGQYECISRLITFQQMQNKIGNISRGEMPYEPVPAAPALKIPDTNDELINRSLSEPLGHTKNFSNLESFASGTKPVRKTTNQNVISGTAEADW